MPGNIAQRLSCLWVRVANLNELPGNSAPSVTVEVPAAVGVPEIRPVAAFTERPDGKPVAL
jgi:hypothetical protein